MKQNLKRSKPIKAFISYQTSDKEIAGKIKEILSDFGIDSFLAHEDITISEEWRDTIINNLKESSLFICLLSKKYLKSSFCLQESGIAYILNIPIIPLSLDGTISPGFIEKFQSKKIEKTPFIYDLIPGMLNFKKTKSKGIEIIIELISDSGCFKNAESNFELIIDILADLSKSQAEKLIDAILNNDQVFGAAKCRHEYLPLFLQTCSDKITLEKRRELKKIIKEFNNRRRKK